MPDITISTKEEEKTQPNVNETVKETLQAADDYQKLKLYNDKLEEEYLRQQELKAKIMMSGRALAGQQTHEKTDKELADEEAAKLINQYR